MPNLSQVLCERLKSEVRESDSVLRLVDREAFIEHAMIAVENGEQLDEQIAELFNLGLEDMRGDFDKVADASEREAEKSVEKYNAA